MSVPHLGGLRSVRRPARLATAVRRRVGRAALAILLGRCRERPLRCLTRDGRNVSGVRNDGDGTGSVVDHRVGDRTDVRARCRPAAADDNKSRIGRGLDEVAAARPGAVSSDTFTPGNLSR